MTYFLSGLLALLTGIALLGFTLCAFTLGTRIHDAHHRGLTRIHRSNQ